VLASLQRAGILPRLEVGAVDDPLETAADRFGEWAAAIWDDRQPEAGHKAVLRGSRLSSPVASRHSNTGETERDTSVGPEGGAAPAPVLDGIRAAQGSGAKLPTALTVKLEAASGIALDEVRVHDDERSERLNRQLQARAFTIGNDIFFRRGTYEPASTGGRRLLGHELGHVVQQRRSPPLPGPDVVTAHRMATAYARGGGLTGTDHIHREPDPMAPSVLQNDPATGAALDAAKFKDFKHYLGQGRKNIDTQIAGQTAAKWHALNAVNPADPQLPVLNARYQAEQAAIETDFVTLQVGMPPDKAAKYKMAIKELQRKLIAAMGGRLLTGILKRDGIFGSSTKSAVKKFQKQNGLPQTGACDIHTWQALDADARAVASRGRQEYAWEEAHEEATGASGTYGMASAIDWAKKDDELQVSVAYQFERAPGAPGNPAAVAINAINSTWNVFNIEYKGPKDPKGKKRKPKNPRIKLTFNPVDSATPPPGGIVIKADQRVLLFSPPHPNAANRGFPDQIQKETRSDAANWNVADVAVLKEIAGHEFGHAIGLEDEYGRRHKDMTRIAGKVAAYDEASTINSVQEFKRKIDNAQNDRDLKAIGAATAALTNEKRAVLAQRYRDDYRTKLPADLRAAMLRVKTSHEARAAAEDVTFQARLALVDPAKAAAQQADTAAANASRAADTAAQQYSYRTPIQQVTKSLDEVKAAATAAKSASDLTGPEFATLLTASDLANFNDRPTAETTNKTAIKASKKSKKLAGDAAAAAQDAVDKQAVLVASATAAIRAATDDLRERRHEARKARSESDEQAALAETAKESQRVAELASVLAVGLARRRERVSGEAVQPDPLKVNVPAALVQAATDAGAAADAAKRAATAATDAAGLAGRTAGRIKRAGPVGVAAGAARVAHAASESARGAAWDMTSQTLALVVARGLAWQRQMTSVDWAQWDGTTNADLWDDAHITAMSTGGLMGRGHGQAKVNSPPIDHTHPLETRHVRRFAEFVMKYKPGDIWEPVHR